MAQAKNEIAFNDNTHAQTHTHMHRYTHAYIAVAGKCVGFLLVGLFLFGPSSNAVNAIKASIG